MGTHLSYLEPLVNGLVHNVCVIQHMIRHNIIAKASDHMNITSLLIVVTYFITTNTTLNVSNILIQYIKNITIIMIPHSKKRTTQPYTSLILQRLSTPYLTFLSKITYHLTSPKTLSISCIIGRSGLLSLLGKLGRRCTFEGESHQPNTTSHKMFFQSILPTWRLLWTSQFKSFTFLNISKSSQRGMHSSYIKGLSRISALVQVFTQCLLITAANR